MNADAPTQDPLLGRLLGNKYRVRRVIGSGGMGAVYEVEHVLTKRRGALKLLHRRIAGEATVVQRFVLEASAAGRIRSPHIVETYDAGELPSGEPFIFMELLDGASLRDRLDRQGAMSLPEALEVVLQAAEGLQRAHEVGIIHRDIKPENLFATRREGGTFVKILDFGISKFLLPDSDLRLTAEGAPMGTPLYMSPEQVSASQGLDARTDVYSLGVVFYECLTGRPPFQAETLAALSLRIFAGKYDPAARCAPELPPAVDAVIARALAVDPEERYADMRSFRVALEHLRGGSAPTLAGTRVEPSVEPGPTRRRAGTRTRTAVLLGGALGSLGAVLGWRFAGPTERDIPSVASTATPEPRRTRASSAPPVRPPPVPMPTHVETEALEPRADAPVDRASPSSPRPGSGPVSRAVREPAGPVQRRGSRPVSRPDADAPSRAAELGLSEENPFAVEPAP